MKKKIMNFAIAFLWIPFIQGGYLSDNIQAEYVGQLWAQESATAQPVKEPQRINRATENAIMNSLLERQKQIESREKSLKEEEKRVEALKKEVAEKMEQLKALEDSLSPVFEAKKADKDKKYVSIAKMYEAAPPEKVAAIFEKMDTKMAAEIILRMNSKKAGAVWASMNNDTSAAIVREITASQNIRGEISQKTEKIEPVSDHVENVVVPDSALRDDSETKKSGAAKTEKVKDDQKNSKKPFSIQVKALRNIEGAQKQVEELKTKGFDARISEMNLHDKGILFRVMVGNFASHAEAIKYMKSKKLDVMYPGSHVPMTKPPP